MYTDYPENYPDRFAFMPFESKNVLVVSDDRKSDGQWECDVFAQALTGFGHRIVLATQFLADAIAVANQVEGEYPGFINVALLDQRIFIKRGAKDLTDTGGQQIAQILHQADPTIGIFSISSAPWLTPWVDTRYNASESHKHPKLPEFDQNGRQATRLPDFEARYIDGGYNPDYLAGRIGRWRYTGVNQSALEYLEGLTPRDIRRIRSSRERE